VYLRPIEELSQRVKSEPMASSASLSLSSSRPSQHPAELRRPASAHILQQQHPSQYSTQYQNAMKASPPRLSPPRLEIKKVSEWLAFASSSPSPRR
jgi:hypothetical protein